jgi:hypothetical protein
MVYGLMKQKGFGRKMDTDRAKILLRAMCDMMEKQEQLSYVESIFELTATWDDTDCDGYCWYDEAIDLLEEGK